MSNCCKKEKILSLGNPQCYETFGEIRRVVFTPKNLYGVSGAYVTAPYPHSITSGTLFVPDLVTLLTNGDAVVTELIEDLTIERSEDTFKTYPNGRRVRIRQGTYTVSFALPLQIAQTITAFKQMYCRELAVYFINKEDKVIGVLSTSGNDLYLAPIALFDKSVTGVFNFQSGDEPEKINVSFVVEDTFTPENLRVAEIDTLDAVVPVYVSMNNLYNTFTESVEFDTVNNRIRTVLMLPNNVGYENVVSSDFLAVAPFGIAVKDLTTNVTTNYTCISYSFNNTTKELTFNFTSLPLTVGNKYQLVRIYGNLQPLSVNIYNDFIKGVETTVGTAI